MNWIAGIVVAWWCVGMHYMFENWTKREPIAQDRPNQALRALFASFNLILAGRVLGWW